MAHCRSSCTQGFQNKPPTVDRIDLLVTLLTLTSCAGQFQCSQCSSVMASAVEYWLLLMLLLICNGFYIWQYLHEDLATWDQPEASQYLEVTLTLGCSSML